MYVYIYIYISADPLWVRACRWTIQKTNIWKTKDDRSWLKAMMARGGRLVGNSELPDGPCGPPWDDLGNLCFCYMSQLKITFSPLGLHLEFPYVDFWISIEIIENHWKDFASNAIWTSKTWHFFHMPLRKPFGASIAMKTMFCLKIRIDFPSCRKRSRGCILTKSKVLGIAQPFHKAPLDLPRASLFTLPATPKTREMLTM